MSKLIGSSLLIILFSAIILLLSGNRILVGERLVNVGEWFTEENRLIEPNDQAILVCSYFTGRSVLSRTMYYSSNNILGRDSCPFVLNDK